MKIKDQTPRHSQQPGTSNTANHVQIEDEAGQSEEETPKQLAVVSLENSQDEADGRRQQLTARQQYVSIQADYQQLLTTNPQLAMIVMAQNLNVLIRENSALAASMLGGMQQKLLQEDPIAAQDLHRSTEREIAIFKEAQRFDILSAVASVSADLVENIIKLVAINLPGSPIPDLVSLVSAIKVCRSWRHLISNLPMHLRLTNQMRGPINLANQKARSERKARRIARRAHREQQQQEQQEQQEQQQQPNRNPSPYDNSKSFNKTLSCHHVLHSHLGSHNDGISLQFYEAIITANREKVTVLATNLPELITDFRAARFPAIHLATLQGDCEILKTLLSAVADPAAAVNTKLDPSAIDYPFFFHTFDLSRENWPFHNDIDIFTSRYPLTLAVRYGMFNVVKTLLAHGADWLIAETDTAGQRTDIEQPLCSLFRYPHEFTEQLITGALTTIASEGRAQLVEMRPLLNISYRPYNNIFKNSPLSNPPANDTRLSRLLTWCDSLPESVSFEIDLSRISSGYFDDCDSPKFQLLFQQSHPNLRFTNVTKILETITKDETRIDCQIIAKLLEEQILTTEDMRENIDALRNLISNLARRVTLIDEYPVLPGIIETLLSRIIAMADGETHLDNTTVISNTICTLKDCLLASISMIISLEKLQQHSQFIKRLISWQSQLIERGVKCAVPIELLHILRYSSEKLELHDFDRFAVLTSNPISPISIFISRDQMDQVRQFCQHAPANAEAIRIDHFLAASDEMRAVIQQHRVFSVGELADLAKDRKYDLIETQLSSNHQMQHLRNRATVYLLSAICMADPVYCRLLMQHTDIERNQAEGIFQLIEMRSTSNSAHNKIDLNLAQLANDVLIVRSHAWEAFTIIQEFDFSKLFYTLPCLMMLAPPDKEFHEKSNLLTTVHKTRDILGDLDRFAETPRVQNHPVFIAAQRACLAFFGSVFGDFIWPRSNLKRFRALLEQVAEIIHTSNNREEVYARLNPLLIELIQKDMSHSKKQNCFEEHFVHQLVCTLGNIDMVFANINRDWHRQFAEAFFSTTSHEHHIQLVQALRASWRMYKEQGSRRLLDPNPHMRRPTSSTQNTFVNSNGFQHLMQAINSIRHEPDAQPQSEQSIEPTSTKPTK